MKKTLLCTVLLIFLTGCGTSDVIEQPAVSQGVEDAETNPEDGIPDSSFSEVDSSVSDDEPNLQTYSDAYLSFEYNADLFTYRVSDSDSPVISIDCSSMPSAPENAHNTVLSFYTVANDTVVDTAKETAQVGLMVMAQSLCQGIFELNDGETIVDENSSISGYVAEYYMEISDGSKCYTKVLNYNDHVSTVIMRLCDYSAEYNDGLMAIYNSAKSEYGDFDFSAENENVETELTAATSPVPSASSETTPTPTPTPEQTPVTTSTITVGQKNALKRAKDYLDYTSFSRGSLISQLKYEGYTTEEATYAVDNCGADWNEQALDKAKDYLDYSSFSYDGLIEQLEYEEFTPEQATYGVDNCGADWNEQAAKKAKSYLDYSSFSRDSLISQLEYEGFTHEQAVYGAQANGY